MLKPVIVLILAVAVCAGILLYGPALAEAVRALLPVDQIDNMPVVETIFTAVIFGGLLLVAVVGGLVCRVNPFAMGRQPWLMLLAGLMAGLLGVVFAIVYASIAGTLGGGASAVASIGLLLWGFAVVMLQAGSEEVFFRGWLQPVLQERWGGIAAILVTSLVFAGLHSAGGSVGPVSLANLFLGGLIFGLLAFHGGGIAGALGFHFAWNATEQLVVGVMPNPGVGSFGAMVDLELSGPAIWGGSEKSLNASAAMTVVLLAILVPLVILARRRLFGARAAAVTGTVATG